MFNNFRFDPPTVPWPNEPEAALTTIPTGTITSLSPELTGTLVSSAPQGPYALAAVSAWAEPTTTTIVINGVRIDLDQLQARVTQLEQQVAMWKSAAQTLAEINREQKQQMYVDKNPTSAYDRAMKVIK